LAFTNPANGRVAGHLAQRFNIVGQQQSFAAHTGCGQRRFGASMTAADDDHIKFLGVQHGSYSVAGGVCHPP